MLKIFLVMALAVISANAGSFEGYEEVNLLFFGAFGMIVVYNLGYYLFIKDNIYADYLLFHIFVFVIMLFYSGTLDDTLLEHSIQGIPVGLFLLAALALLSFSKNFLDISSLDTKLEKYTKYLQYTLLLFFALSVFPVSSTWMVGIAILVIIFIALSLLVLSSYLGFVKKEVKAYFYLVGFSGILISIIVALSSYFSLIDEGVQMVYIIEFSLLFEATILSFAISYKHKRTMLKLKQNELLFKELSHRVQNNLQAIISILTLQKNRVKEIELKNYLQDTINRIRSISLIHQNLQNSDTAGEVNLKVYLSTLLNAYNSLNQEVDFTLECDPDLKLSLEKLTPLALVVNELITNSIKHAFIDTKQAKISIKLLSDNGYKFVYEDNGKGFVEVNESLGSLLIQNLSTEQLKGRYSVDSKDRYRFSLEF